MVIFILFSHATDVSKISLKALRLGLQELDEMKPPHSEVRPFRILLSTSKK